MTKLSPQGQTTMLQDIEAKRRTEVDYLACTVAEPGKNSMFPRTIGCCLPAIYIFVDLMSKYYYDQLDLVALKVTGW